MDAGYLLPQCDVVVRDEPGGRLFVGFMDPVAVLQMTRSVEEAPRWRMRSRTGCSVRIRCW